MSTPKLLAFATQGPESGDQQRLLRLLDSCDCEFISLDRTRKGRTFFSLLGRLVRRDGRIAVLEGTGASGGFAVILASLLAHRAYVVSSGDAVAPFLAARWPWAYPLFWLYEKALYRCSRGFIGWTPYLAGRALTMGAPRAMTAAGFARFPPAGDSRIREQLGIPPGAVVFGIAGTLGWSKRFAYCYGLELVEAALALPARTAYVLIAGDGTGLAELRRRAGARAGVDIFFAGHVAPQQVPEYLAAMDVGLLPQSVDGVGNFRYSTKAPEYLAAKLPLVCNQNPAAYDLFSEFCWILPGRNPWDPRYIAELSRLMATLRPDDVHHMRERIPGDLREFDEARQKALVRRFLEDLSR